ncbi:MAG: RluA family pseudouridine synthase [Erysipelotrichaceae bacterium]
MKVIIKDIVNQRLDQFVAAQKNISRSLAQKLIKDAQVLVNDDAQKANYLLKLNDVVVIKIPDNSELALEAVDMNLDIVYQDSDVAVINKPKNLVVHPAPGVGEPTLVHGLLFAISDLSGINGVNRPGIVHRIDKDTTGLLIVAKNDFAHQQLAEQLQDKTLQRKYLALVHNNFNHNDGTIDAPIGRSNTDRKKMAVTAKNSKEAITHFKVLKQYDGYALVECELTTGRTHQIRVHMQYIKHPVVGDHKYSKRKTLNSNGQMLHAYKLKFTHPRTKKIMEFEVDLPEYFKKILKELADECK